MVLASLATSQSTFKASVGAPRSLTTLTTLTNLCSLRESWPAWTERDGGVRLSDHLDSLRLPGGGAGVLLQAGGQGQQEEETQKYLTLAQHF